MPLVWYAEACWTSFSGARQVSITMSRPWTGAVYDHEISLVPTATVDCAFSGAAFGTCRI
jgi:hypothetical protein